jgi:single-strand DNA-binding protein
MYNCINLIGNIGKDPEIKTFESGTKKVSFSLAVSEKRKDKSTGEEIESVQWFYVETWNKLGDIVERYCRKGDRLFVSGRMLSSKYINDNGEEKERFFVNCNNLKMLSTKPKSNDNGSDQFPDRNIIDNQSGDDDLPF